MYVINVRIYLFMYLFMYLPIYLFIHLFIYLLYLTCLSMNHHFFKQHFWACAPSAEKTLLWRDLQNTDLN